MSKADQETLAVYDAGAADYAAKFSTGAPYDRLETFLDRLPAGARVLDLGCGAGSSAARIAERGFETVALDASTGMAAEAKRLFDLDVIVDTFDAVPNLGKFDGVWAHFSLLHAPLEELPRHLANIHAALRPEGHVLIAMKTGDGMARDTLGRRYSYVTETGLHDALTATGFTVDGVDKGADEGFDGVVAPWVIFTAHA